jgi:hypothetical protein
MTHAAVLLCRLAVYAAALFVVVTARLPELSTTVPSLRTAPGGPAVEPVRLAIAGVLIVGIVLEVLRRRPVWR